MSDEIIEVCAFFPMEMKGFGGGREIAWWCGVVDGWRLIFLITEWLNLSNA
jgi:hypothetical protein